MGGYERAMLQCYNVITSVRACVFLYTLRTRIILVSCITQVERVPIKTPRILYSIKLGFLDRLMKQINKSFIYEKDKTPHLLLIRNRLSCLTGRSYCRLQCAYALCTTWPISTLICEWMPPNGRPAFCSFLVVAHSQPCGVK